MVDVQFDKFVVHTAVTVRNLLTDSSFCDVILTCDSQGSINAHKFLLSSASNVFMNIFSDSTFSPQMVFLRGVQFEDLAALVKFIYLGVAVAADHMDSFFSTARDLEIKGLMNESHPLSRESSLSRDIIKAELEDNDNVPSSDDPNISEFIKHRTKLIEDQASSLQAPGPSSQKEPSQFLCGQCDSSFVNKATLQHHINSQHLKIKFACEEETIFFRMDSL
jgi:hypothetical protein